MNSRSSTEVGDSGPHSQSELRPIVARSRLIWSDCCQGHLAPPRGFFLRVLRTELEAAAERGTSSTTSHSDMRGLPRGQSRRTMLRREVSAV